MPRSAAHSVTATRCLYAADDDGNREAGYGVYQSNRITNCVPTAVLINGSYNDNNPGPSLLDGGNIAGTFNAVAFNELWSHPFDKQPLQGHRRPDQPEPGR